MPKAHAPEYNTVSEFIERLNDSLGELSGAVTGEISELTISAKGHVYFTIKDAETGDVLPCTMWKSSYALNGLSLELGMEVVVRGVPEFYGKFGKLSYIARSASLVGEGALKLAYEKLKKKLDAEGLFAESRKRELPQFPKTIGIITSVHGDVIHDVTSNIRRAGFHLKILDCRVEGPESGRALALSVRAMRREKVDVLLLMRGGGSIQSLAGFDNEALVREIASFPRPVIAGIGHHNDVTLAALAADAAESTPSMVAALLNESWDVAERTLEHAEYTIINEYESMLQDSRQRIAHTLLLAQEVFVEVRKRYEQTVWRLKVSHHALRERPRGLSEAINTNTRAIVFRMRSCISQVSSVTMQEVADDIITSYGSSLSTVKSRYADHPSHISQSYALALRTCNERTDALTRIVESHNPHRQLALGYSIATHNGRVVRSVHEVARGAKVRVRLADGTISTERIDGKR